MLSPELQERLTRVGPGRPMGALLRRYWFPIAASIELEPGGALPARLLGEDLVLFRGADGELGLVEERCPHRGASLRHGCVDESGIRCPYHGWKFSPEGEALEVPGEPESFRARVRARAYRAQELGGLVFAYLGPEPAPLLPRYDLLVTPGGLRDVGRATLPCNWLQIMENSVDPRHVEWLHGHHLGWVRGRRGEAGPTRYLRRHRRIGFTPFRHGIVKRRILEGGSEEDQDWRVGHPLVFPCMLRVGEGLRHRAQFRVPVDDTTTLHLWYSHYRLEGSGDDEAEVPIYEVPWRDEAGGPLLDFVDGGDVHAWVSQGPIADRTRETLCGGDEGIVLYRRMLLEQIGEVEAGRDPLGVIRDPEENRRIELGHEAEKLGDGATTLRESIEMGHGRYSPLKDRVLSLLGE